VVINIIPRQELTCQAGTMGRSGVRVEPTAGTGSAGTVPLLPRQRLSLNCKLVYHERNSVHEKPNLPVDRDGKRRVFFVSRKVAKLPKDMESNGEPDFFHRWGREGETSLKSFDSSAWIARPDSGKEATEAKHASRAGSAFSTTIKRLSSIPSDAVFMTKSRQGANYGSEEWK